MKISRIKLKNFRNLKDLDQKIDQDFIVLVGGNGAGKTNFLESIFYSSVLLAFPPNKSWELIAFGEDYFRINLSVEDSRELEYYYGRKNERQYQRSQKIDGVRKKTHDILGQLPTVAFLPQDLNLLQLSPSLRREYLDDVLLQTEKDYEQTLTEFVKTIKQRNELLAKIRDRQAQVSELDFWDDKLIELSSSLATARQNFSEFLNQDLPQFYSVLTGSEKFMRFQYQPSPKEGTEGFAEALLARRAQDIASATTSIGPHRDDWLIADEKGGNLAHFLSRGEQRSVIIALKMKEARYLEDSLGKTPIVLLDELLAELDEERKRQVLLNLPQKTQVFLTTSTQNEIPPEVLKKAQVIELIK